MSDFYVKVGDTAVFEKPVGESDVYMFAGITGDLSPNHVNEKVMARSKYGQRIAHGALMVGYMSTASTMVVEQCARPDATMTPVSLGYDRIRFVGAVLIGDTITVTYVIKRIEPEKNRSYSEIVITNQHGDTVAVGQHILKWVPNN